MHYLCTEIKPHLVDAQVYSEHLASLGAEEIDRNTFVEIVRARLNLSLNI
jgi:Leu/Phe-tRNA-protein transferase